MKKASIGLLILALVGLAGATTFVRNSTTTHVEGWITVPIACLDTFPSAGPLKPDSIQVFVWRDSMGYNACTWDTSITDTSSAFLDFKKRGNTASNTPFWYFRAQISDIDGDGSVAPYHGMIQAYAQAHPTPNRFSFQIIDDDTTLSQRLALLDAKITSRLAPSTAGNNLDVNANGEAGIDWGNIGNQASSTPNVNVTNLNGNAVQDSSGYIKAASLMGGVNLTKINGNLVVDSAGYLRINRAIGTSPVNVIEINGNAAQDSAGYLKVSRVYAYADSAGYLRVASAPLSDAQMIALFDSTYQMRAMAAKLGVLGTRGDNQTAVRYISSKGTNADGLSPKTAWTKFDSLTAWSKTAACSTKQEKYVFIDGYFTQVACSLWADNMHLVGNGWATIVRGDTTRIGSALPDSSDTDVFRIFSDYVSIENLRIQACDTTGDPETPPWASGGNNAITYDTTASFGEVSRCLFPLLNHKPPQVNVRGSWGAGGGQAMYFHDNIFIEPHIAAIDAFLTNSRVENNTIYRLRGSYQGRPAIDVIGSSWGYTNDKGLNVIKGNNILSCDAGISLTYSDSNLVAGNYFSNVKTPLTSGTKGNNTFLNNYLVGSRNLISGGFLANPGFEIWETGTKSSIPAYWGSITGTPYIMADYRHTGSYSLWMPENSSLKTDTLYLTPGVYQFHLYARPKNGAGDTLDVSVQNIGGGSLAEWQLTNPVAGRWNSFGGWWRKADSLRCYFQIAASLGDEWYIDDVYFGLGAVPEYYVEANTRGGEKLAVLSDSLHYQGAASGLTVDAVAKATAESLRAGGMYHKGTGDHLDSILVLDSSDSSAISGVDAILRASGGTSAYGKLATGVDGLVVFAVGTGTYDLYLAKQGYSFAAHYHLTISEANRKDTIYASQFRPSPILANQCQVWGNILTPDTLKGTTVKAMLVDSLSAQFDVSAPPRIGNTIITRYEFTATTTSSQWVLSLVPNSLITPAKSKWQFKIRYPNGTYLEKTVTVPDSGAWELKW